MERADPDQQLDNAVPRRYFPMGDLLFIGQELVDMPAMGPDLDFPHLLSGQPWSSIHRHRKGTKKRPDRENQPE